MTTGREQSREQGRASGGSPIRVGPSQLSSDYQQLLRSVVDVAAAIFGAAASSILLLDEETDELVFEAVSGAGSETLVGSRFPRYKGIAGWVLETGQSITTDDVSQHGSFAQDVAEETEYVPTAIMAAPVIHEGEVLGVLEVLDPGQQSRSSLSDLDLLALFAAQAGVAVACVRRAVARPSDRAQQRRHAEAIGIVEGVRELGPEYREVLVRVLRAVGPLPPAVP